MNGGSELSRDASPSQVQFCPLCGKPFAVVTSYNRHLSYCRRAQIRGQSRRKSCRACSAAKTKCSFHDPCSRCIAKGIDCSYEHLSRRLSTALNTDLAVAPLTHGSSPLDETFEFSDVEVPSGFDPFPTVPNLHGWLDVTIDDVADIDLTSNAAALGNSQPASGFSDLVTGNAAGSFPRSVQRKRYLSPLCTLEPLGRQNRKLLIDILCAIPEQMLRRETLPPFIHGHWNRKAMPEALAVCMKIAQLFASRTLEITPFIWRTVLQEQRRVIQELPKLTKQDLLAAIQAGMVYLIMRVVDGTAISQDWNQEMAASQSILCDRFLDLHGGKFCEDEISNPSLTWESWIFAEERRRTSCVWFLITRTITVKSKDGCPTSEQPWQLPLPASRLQWEARSYETWIKELGAGNPAITTFGDLIDSKKRSDEGLYAQRYGSWIARTDSLGCLLNIAVAVI